MNFGFGSGSDLLGFGLKIVLWFFRRCNSGSNPDVVQYCRLATVAPGATRAYKGILISKCRSVEV